MPTDSELSRFGLDVYFDTDPDDRNIIPDGWHRIDFEAGPDGFFAAVYGDAPTNPDEIVIAFRGREGGSFSADNPDVAALLTGEIPNQFHAAWQFYNDVRLANQNANISLTGHSLGGALASLIFVRDGQSTSSGDIQNAVVFNPVSSRARAELIVNGRPGVPPVEPLGGSLEHEGEINRIVTEGEIASSIPLLGGGFLGTETLLEVGNEGSPAAGLFDLHSIALTALLLSKGTTGDSSFVELSQRLPGLIPQLVNDALVGVEGFPTGSPREPDFSGYLEKLLGGGPTSIDTLHTDVTSLAATLGADADVANEQSLNTAFIQFLWQFSAAQVEAERPAEDFKAVLAQAGGALIARLDRFNQDGLSITGNAILDETVPGTFFPGQLSTGRGRPALC